MLEKIIDLLYSLLIKATLLCWFMWVSVTTTSSNTSWKLRNQKYFQKPASCLIQKKEQKHKSFIWITGYCERPTSYRSIKTIMNCLSKIYRECVHKPYMVFDSFERETCSLVLCAVCALSLLREITLIYLWHPLVGWCWYACQLCAHACVSGPCTKKRQRFCVHTSVMSYVSPLTCLYSLQNK